MQLFGIKTPLIKPGDDMAGILIKAMKAVDTRPQDNDIIVLAESAVASAEGRIVDLESIKPGKKAIELSKLYENDPRKMELIIRESDEILGGIPGVVVTITKGVLSPSAGIDNSNAPEGHVVLLPEDPKKSAVEIRKKLMAEYGCSLAVIIGDSRTQPLRLGCVGIALGCAGIEPVEDMRGHKDLFGKPLLITRRATADNLVSAAQLIMGEADESTPAVLIRDAPVRFIEGSEDIQQISREECLYFACFDKTINDEKVKSSEILSDSTCPLLPKDWVMFLSNEIYILENMKYRGTTSIYPSAAILAAIGTGIISWMLAVPQLLLPLNDKSNIVGIISFFSKLAGNIVIILLAIAICVYLFFYRPVVKKIDRLRLIREKIILGELTDSNKIREEWQKG